MTDFLALALEQGQEEERETDMKVVIPSLRAVFSPDRTEAGKEAPRQENGGEPVTERRGRAESVLERRSRERMGEAPAETTAAEERTVGLLSAGMGAHTGGPYGDDAGKAGPGGGEWGEGSGAVRERGEIALLGQVQRAERATSFVQGPRRNLTVAVPETAGGDGAGVTVELLDRVAERDARRYDGGFSMY